MDYTIIGNDVNLASSWTAFSSAQSKGLAFLIVREVVPDPPQPPRSRDGVPAPPRIPSSLQVRTQQQFESWSYPFQLNTREQYRGGGTSNTLAIAVASARAAVVYQITARYSTISSPRTETSWPRQLPNDGRRALSSSCHVDLVILPGASAGYHEICCEVLPVCHSAIVGDPIISQVNMRSLRKAPTNIEEM
jgi:hypothetical protein